MLIFKDATTLVVGFLSLGVVLIECILYGPFKSSVRDYLVKSVRRLLVAFSIVEKALIIQAQYKVDSDGEEEATARPTACQNKVFHL